MTNDELQAHIKALNDAAASGQIEVFAFGDWTECKTWTHPNAYRIKPKPREVFLHSGDLPFSMGVTTGTSIIGVDFYSPDNRSGLVKFREVIE